MSFYVPFEILQETLPTPKTKENESYKHEGEKNYHIYYSLRSDEGITLLKYIKDGDYWTDYTGDKIYSPLSILDAEPKNSFNVMSDGPLCFIYKREDPINGIICKICDKVLSTNI